MHKSRSAFQNTSRERAQFVRLKPCIFKITDCNLHALENIVDNNLKFLKQ